MHDPADPYALVLIDLLDHLLRMSVDIGTQQTGKTAYAVVHVHYVVAGLYCAQFLE